MNHQDNKPIYVIGSSNTDMVVKTTNLPSPGETLLGDNFSMVPGGKGANQAVAASRLGGQVVFVGNVGNDIFGEGAIEALNKENINCDFINRDQGLHSGVALIIVDTHGENQIVVAPGANNSLSPDRVDTALNNAPEESIILTQLEIPLSTVSHIISKAKEKKLRVILDPAPAPPDGLSDEIIEGSYLITPNETEAKLLTGIDVIDENSALKASKILLDAGAKNIIVTMGANGSFLSNLSGSQFFASSKVKAVDSTAAGDCFNGALATLLSQGHSLPNSISFANRAAAVSVTRMGAQTSLPFVDEVKD